MAEATHKTPLDSFYGMLQKRVADWLVSEEADSFPCAAMYRYLPDFFNLLVHLALDPRLPERERKATFSALKYIVAPFDLIPEAVFGTSGFRDDLVLAALIIDRLSRVVDPVILAEHWRQPGQPAEIARVVLDAGDSIVGREMCDKLRAWVPEE